MIAYSGNNSPGTMTVSDGTHTASIALPGNYSLANFTASSDGHGGTSSSTRHCPRIAASSTPRTNWYLHRCDAGLQIALYHHAPPGGPAPPPYAKLAGLLDQYMAAGSGQVVWRATSWTTSQQAWLGGDKEFLTKPQG